MGWSVVAALSHEVSGQGGQQVKHGGGTGWGIGCNGCLHGLSVFLRDFVGGIHGIQLFQEILCAQAFTRKSVIFFPVPEFSVEPAAVPCRRRPECGQSPWLSIRFGSMKKGLQNEITHARFARVLLRGIGKHEVVAHLIPENSYAASLSVRRQYASASRHLLPGRLAPLRATSVWWWTPWEPL